MQSFKPKNTFHDLLPQILRGNVSPVGSISSSSFKNDDKLTEERLDAEIEQAITGIFHLSLIKI